MVSRERSRHFDREQAIETLTASEETIRLQRVLNDDGEEVRLHCHSAGREAKETAITDRFVKRFEAGLTEEGPEQTPRAETVGHHPAAHRSVEEKQPRHRPALRDHVVADETGTKAASITWTKNPVTGSMLTDPGVYCLRSNEAT